MPRFNITMPQELWDRVGVEADRSAGGNKSFVIRRALEAALGNRGGPSAGNGDEAVALTGPAPVPPRASERPLDPMQAAGLKAFAPILPELAGRTCSRCGVPIKSPSLTRHPSCGGKIVPEPE